MKKKREFQIYTGMWIGAILILLALLWQNMGDARIINYSGLVRGATQKLVKEELNREPDDLLIAKIDGIIYDLQTGAGAYELNKSQSGTYQRQLAALKLVWEAMKAEIPAVRGGRAEPDRLFALSQQHFEMADRLVQYAEQDADAKLMRSIVFYLFSLVLSVTIFAVFRRKNQKALEKSLSVDGLTGLLNRSGFEARAAQLLRQQGKTEYVIVEFDIDNFKVINDVCGYAQGDQLLCGLAAAIARWKGPEHLCARIDADDFVLLARGRDTVVPELEEVLRQAVREQDFLEAFGGVHLTFGAYQLGNNDELIKTVMDKANTAHKTAKVQESRSVVWYDEALLRKLKQENRYKERMHQGLRNNEFQLYLQPKINLSDLRIIGAEALVRWQPPDEALLYPDAFIPLFERNGSIVELDFYMLEKTCGYLREQLDGGAAPFPVSVNFSRVTLYYPMFADRFVQIVDRCALPHACIEVEVTESAFNEVSDAVLEILTDLKRLGFPVSMDDFGAGYSNLNLLGKLPIEIIKLDRAFLRETERNGKMRGVVACVVELAHAMGLRVVCEGVEQPEHVAFLREIGCDYAQGYYFSRPVPRQDFAPGGRYPEPPLPDGAACPVPGNPVLAAVGS